MRESLSRKLHAHYAEVVAAGLAALVVIGWIWPAHAGQVHVAPAFVVAVRDGDTIEVVSPLGPVPVRLARVDCPEVAHRRRPGQPGGEEAKAFVAHLVLGRWVALRVHGRDRYGRVIADVSILGRDLGTELIRAGWAWHYRQYDQDARLDALEDQARRAHRGLWGLPGTPVPPWEWRKTRGR